MQLYIINGNKFIFKILRNFSYCLQLIDQMKWIIKKQHLKGEKNILSASFLTSQYN